MWRVYFEDLLGPLRSGPEYDVRRGANLCWALGGEIICHFTPILPYFQHWRDKPRPRFFSGEQIKWNQRNQKKRSSPEMERLFSPKSSRYAHQSQIIGGDADKDHTQIIGGNTVKLLGGIYPPGFRHPWMYVPPESSSRRRWFWVITKMTADSGWAD